MGANNSSTPAPLTVAVIINLLTLHMWWQEAIWTTTIVLNCGDLGSILDFGPQNPRTMKANQEPVQTNSAVATSVESGGVVSIKRVNLEN